MLPPKAYIFIGLNAIRALSIIALLLVFSSSILVMVDDIKAVNAFMNARSAASSGTADNSTFPSDMLDCDYIEGSTVPNQPAGVFWAVLNRLLIIFQVVILMLSELGWPYKFFDKFFPVLGSNFGLGALGLFQCLLGAAVLSHHVDDFALVSAFFLFALGCLNILIGLIFREKAKAKRSITTFRAEKKMGVLPTSVSVGPITLNRPMFTSQPPSFTTASRFSGHSAEHEHGYGADEKGSIVSNEKGGYGFSGMGFGRQAEKAYAGGKGLLISKPVEALPPYGPGARVAAPVASHATGESSASEQAQHGHAGPARNVTFQSSGEAL